MTGRGSDHGVEPGSVGADSNIRDSPAAGSQSSDSFVRVLSAWVTGVPVVGLILPHSQL